MGDLNVENMKEIVHKTDDAEVKRLLKRMRPAMLLAMRKQAELQSVGIRSEVKQRIDDRTGHYIVSVIPNKVDVAIYGNKIGV